MRLRIALLAALVLLLAAACGDDGGSAQDDGDPPSTTEGPPTRPTDGPAPDLDDLPEGTVVFSPDDVEADPGGEPTTWTPSAQDVDGVDQTLAAYIEDNPDLGVEPLDDYVRQYLGTGEIGEIVSVNGVCDEDFPWEDELIVVNDGGSCFWQAEFSFFTLDVDSFTVNGEA
jgi:hypothetical protein